MKTKYFSFKLLFGLLILTVLIAGFYGPMSEHVVSMNYFYVFLAFVVILVVIAIKQVKWYLLMGNVREKKLAVKSYFTGQFINEIAPMGTGDLTKAYMIRKYTKKPFGFALSIPYMERVIDISVLSVFAILSSVFLFLNTMSSYLSLIFILILGLAVILFLLATFPVKIARVFKSILEFKRRIIPIKFIDRVIKKLEVFIVETSKDFQEAIKAFKNRKIFLLTILALVLFDWVLEGVVQVMLIKSVGYDIPILISIGIVAISWLVSIPSMIPGGLGVRETVTSLLFSSVGIPFPVALVSVLTYRALVVFIFSSGALISLKIEPG
jgi:uncharacterized protein (TIRG00374 family)